MKNKKLNEFRNFVIDEIENRFDEDGEAAILEEKVSRSETLDVDIDTMEEVVDGAIDSMHPDKTDEEEMTELVDAMNEAFPWLDAKLVETGESRLFHQYDGRPETDEGYYDNYLSVDFLNGLVGDNEEVNYAERWLADMEKAYTSGLDEDDLEEWEEFQATAKYKEVSEIAKKNPHAVVYISSGGYVDELLAEHEITCFHHDNYCYTVRKEYEIEYTIN